MTGEFTAIVPKRAIIAHFNQTSIFAHGCCDDGNCRVTYSPLPSPRYFSQPNKNRLNSCKKRIARRE
jgi:hypothetical protein